jgi:hypothetical protein
MTYPICSCNFVSLRRLLKTFALAAAPLFLTAMLYASPAPATDRAGKGVARPCGFIDTAFDPATDVHALDNYRVAVAQLLKQEQFETLDCIADAARTGKTRFSGGALKLRNIFIGLDSPRPGHPTQEDWKKHLHLIEHWSDQNEHSSTARIALAEAYINYAWDARGEGFSDSVTQNGWKVFEERLNKAKSILDHSASLADKVSEWYVAMEMIARGEGWDLPRFRTLLDRAVAFDPEDQYYYRIYAEVLQPKWMGQEGDAARYAEETANRIGGDSGDILYFLISEGILCGCQESEFGHFSWPRLQKGFVALEKKYGPSLISVNAYTLMAVKSNDWVVADPGFKRIGDKWNKDLWVTEVWFTSNRDMAAQLASSQLRAKANRQEAEGNMKTPQGQAYEAEFQAKFAAFERSCSSESKGDQSKFDFLVQVGKDGGVEDAHPETQPSPFAMCLMKTLYNSYVRKETPFPQPPSDNYKLLLQVDPTTLSAATK